MQDQPQHFHRDPFTVTTDRTGLNLDAALGLLRRTRWGNGLTRDVLARAVAHSVCFSLSHGPSLIGFARVITDLATYAYLTDVVIDESWRGQGLGRWLVECILAHPDLQGLRRLALVTLDAQALYQSFGFGTDTGALTYMERRDGEHPRTDPG